MRAGLARLLAPAAVLAATAVPVKTAPPAVLTPAQGPTRTLVTISGAALTGGAVYWDGAAIPTNVGARLFSVPPNATPGRHSVSVRTQAGLPLFTTTFTVAGTPLNMGAPRIDSVMTLDATFTGGNMSGALYVQGANFDVGAVVEVNGVAVATIAHKALKRPLLVAAALLQRPIYHYVALAAVLGPRSVGSSLSVRVRNLDNMTSESIVYRIPEAQSALDSDGDALADSWEAGGYDADGDGKSDADPYRRDIFVELDTMEDVGFAPTDTALTAVRTMFRAAPFLNPYRQDNGINLVIDTSGTVPFAPWIYFDRPDLIENHPGQTVAFSSLKPTYFNHRSLGDKYHYIVWAMALDSGDAGYSDRTGPDGSGDDAALGLEGYSGVTSINDRTEAELLAHELGHNLGQRHGGANDENPNPSYYSVMSKPWLMRTSRTAQERRKWPTCYPYYYGERGADEGAPPMPPMNVNMIIDYSAGMGRAITEGRLNELAGICGHGIDWNHSGVIDTAPSSGVWPEIDLNENASVGDVFADYPNWSRLQFDGPRTKGQIP